MIQKEKLIELRDTARHVIADTSQVPMMLVNPTTIIELVDENILMRGAILEVVEYLEWERKAFENAWCQDGSRKYFMRDVIESAAKRLGIIGGEHD